MFVYKCKLMITGYAMRRSKWNELDSKFPDMARQLKVHLVTEFDNDIRQPLLEHKHHDIATLRNRSDFENVVAIQEVGDDEMRDFFSQMEEEEDLAKDGVTYNEVNKRIGELEEAL